MTKINFMDRAKLIMTTARATLYPKTRVILVCPNIKKQESMLEALSNISCDNKNQTKQEGNTITFRNGSSITCLPSSAVRHNTRSKRAKIAPLDWSDGLIDDKMLYEVLFPFIKELKWWQRLRIKLYNKLPGAVYLSSRWRR